MEFKEKMWRAYKVDMEHDVILYGESDNYDSLKALGFSTIFEGITEAEIVGAGHFYYKRKHRQKISKNQIVTEETTSH